MMNSAPEIARHADRLLWRWIRTTPGWTVTLVSSLIANAAATLTFPALFAAAIDSHFTDGGPRHITAWLVAVLVVLVVSGTLAEVAAASAKAAATRGLRHCLLRHTLALGLPGREGFPAGDVVSRLAAGAMEAGSAGPTLVSGILSLLVSAGGVAGLALIDWRLALTFLVAVPLGAVLVRKFVSRTSRLVDEYLATYGAVSGRLVEALGGVRTIHAAGTVHREVRRVLEPVGELRRLGGAIWRTYGAVSCQSSLLAPGVQLTVLSVAGYAVASGWLTPGQFVASLSYAWLGLAFMEQTNVMMALARARGGARRLAEILGVRPFPAGTAALPAGPGQLVLREVTVHAQGRAVLDSLNLTVPAGTSVAVVGASAAGKSTLAAVAGRLVAPDCGQVRLDGVPLETVDPAILRREITYAFERPELLGATVAEAITLGLGKVDRERVEAAGRAADADTFVRRLPHGYDTPLDQAHMSGGEAQRVGLARSAVRLGRLLILDDATSDLDTITEMRVRAVLDTAFAGRTRIVVAHRPATVARCDLVAWLDGGRVRALAPHTTLCRDPAYRALFSPLDADTADNPMGTNTVGAATEAVRA
jgi:ATP-binding cassette, subfamily B, bacterial